jgi:hypothetical protein
MEALMIHGGRSDNKRRESKIANNGTASASLDVMWARRIHR